MRVRRCFILVRSAGTGLIQIIEGGGDGLDWTEG